MGKDDWAYLTVGGEEKPLLLDLTAGWPTIRMTNLGDGLALDWLALIRENAFSAKPVAILLRKATGASTDVAHLSALGPNQLPGACANPPDCSPGESPSGEEVKTMSQAEDSVTIPLASEGDARAAGGGAHVSHSPAS